MTRRTLAAALLLLSALLPGGARGDGPGAVVQAAAGARGGEPAAPPTGFQLLSAPDGAEVFLDERRVGKTPLPGVTAADPGEHRLRVTQPGYAPYAETFRVYRRKVASLLIEMVPIAGVLRLRASIEGARVFVDGKFAGDAPIELELLTGPHTVRVSYRGYRDEIFTTNAVPGMVIDREVQLSEMSAHADLTRQITAPQPRLATRWWIVPVAIIGAGAVATAVIVPTVLGSRSACQRVDVEVCVPVHSVLDAKMLSVSLPF